MTVDAGRSLRLRGNAGKAVSVSKTAGDLCDQPTKTGSTQPDRRCALAVERPVAQNARRRIGKWEISV